MEQYREEQLSTSKIPLVVYDTSSLIAIFKEKIDTLTQVRYLVGPHVPVVPIPVLKELEILSKSKDRKTALAAKLCIQHIINKLSIARICTDLRADDAVLCCADFLRKNYKVFVVTCDLELRKRLIEHGIDVVYLRQGRFFTLEQ